MSPWRQFFPSTAEMEAISTVVREVSEMGVVIRTASAEGVDLRQQHQQADE